MRAKAFVLALAVGAALPATAGATIFNFQAFLLGTNESPSVDTTGSGYGRLYWDDVLNTATYDITFQNLIGDTTASHTHSQTPGQPGPNFTVATTTPTYTGFPLGVKFGTFHAVFDLNAASSYNAAYVTAFGGTVPGARDALLAGLQSGTAYLNIHSSFRPGGEIRANWIAAPEPGAWALMIGGFGAVGMVLRRRRTAAALT